MSLKQSEPYIPWSNAAEREIKELTKGAGHNLLRYRAPKHLRDDYSGLEAYIMSNTAHEIYKLDREVTKTVMLAATSDIIQLSELEWFKWVMFWDETIPFPDNELKLGHYLGPKIDVCPAITAKILTENGQVLHTSTYRPLTPDDLLQKDGTEAWEQFMARVYDRLWSQVLPRDLEDIGLEILQHYDPYEDETKNYHTFLERAEELEPMPEVGNHQIGANIMLPIGDEMARGHTVKQKHNASGNIMGRAHSNLLINTRLYQVKFKEGNIMEWTTNAIAENKYPQCEANEN